MAVIEMRVGDVVNVTRNVTIGDEKYVPRNAMLKHGHWYCRLRSHASLEWNEGCETTKTGATKMWIESATCGVCGRDQPTVLITWPPERVVPTALASDKVKNRPPYRSPFLRRIGIAAAFTYGTWIGTIIAGFFDEPFMVGVGAVVGSLITSAVLGFTRFRQRG
jgi:hypothetical protein